MFKKTAKHFNDNQVCYVTFITGLIIIAAIFALQNVAPFGRNSLLTIDFFHQYGPMLGELYDRVRNGSNLIYSFTMGMGLPFLRNFLNYLSSPFNIIIFFFNRENIVMSFSLIIALKAVGSAMTMNYYLSKKFNTISLFLVPLGLLYGFCAYFTAYYWNIMWLDGLVMLPLVVWGIEKIINEDKCTFYIVSLAIMLVANYFIGFMICFFSVLYFIAYLILQAQKFDIKYFLKKGILFGGSSLLAGGLTAFLLLPLFLGLHSISATSDTWPTSQYYWFSFWEYLANHFSGVGSTVLSSGISNAPNISVGILTVTLVFLFLVNPHIKTKIKLVYFSLLFFIVASFFYAPLDFIWHAFHVPNDLPYRYSFLYSFVLIIIAAYAIIYLNKLSIKLIGIVQIFVLLLIGVLYFFNYKNIDNNMLLLNIILVFLYFTLYILYKYYPIIKAFIPYTLILAVIMECIIVVNHNWHIQQYIDEFYADYNPTQDALKFIREKDNDIYRIEKTSILTFNDPSWYNYYGQTTFSSMAYQDMAVMQNYLGLPGNNINSYYYKQTTPIYDLMFNIKYFFGSTWDGERYSLYYNNYTTTIFKHNYNAGLMFAVNKQIVDWQSIGLNPFFLQNDFISKATGIDNVLTRLDPTTKDTLYDVDGRTIIKYTFNNPQENMYFYLFDPSIDFFVVDETLYYFNSGFHYFSEASEAIKIMDYVDFNEKHIINRRTEEKTYPLYIGYNNYRYDAYNTYSIDNSKYEKVALELQSNKVNITKFKEHYITGSITATEDKTIYTSIPFDDGWQVKVDGYKVETFRIGNALMGFNINPGIHEIVLSYTPKGFILGSIISVISLCSVTGVVLYQKRKNG